MTAKEMEECMDKECPGEKDAYPCDIETGLSSYRTVNVSVILLCVETGSQNNILPNDKILFVS